MRKIVWILAIVAITATATIVYLNKTIYSHNNRHNMAAARPEPNVVIIAMMKSGSENIAYNLVYGLNYNRLDLYSTYEKKFDRFYNNLSNFFKESNKLSKTHHRAPRFMDELNIHEARDFDIDNFKKHSDRLIIHLRDPRQVLLSLVHHMNKFEDDKNMPDGYFKFSLDKQIDWCIDNLLKIQVEWINGWLALKEKEDQSPNGLKILITTYDELLLDEKALYNKILDFYDIPRGRFHYISLANEKRPNFRKGDPNEWRKVFSEEQKQRVAKVVPQDLLQRFRWDK